MFPRVCWSAAFTAEAAGKLAATTNAETAPLTALLMFLKFKKITPHK
jgi:hypothetical protein